MLFNKCFEIGRLKSHINPIALRCLALPFSLAVRPTFCVPDFKATFSHSDNHKFAICSTTMTVMLIFHEYYPIRQNTIHNLFIIILLVNVVVVFGAFVWKHFAQSLPQKPNFYKITNVFCIFGFSLSKFRNKISYNCQRLGFSWDAVNGVTFLLFFQNKLWIGRGECGFSE